MYADKYGTLDVMKSTSRIKVEPFGGPAAWRGREQAERTDWIGHLDDAQVAELDAALDHAKAAGSTVPGLTRAGFPLPTLSTTIDSWAHELRHGRGFLLIRGIPLHRYPQADAELMYWGIGRHLGIPTVQNPQGHVLGYVTDTGAKEHDPNVRLYQTADHIALHRDGSEVVGLACYRAAVEGGRSRLCSSIALHDAIVEQRPDLVDALYSDFPMDKRGEHGPQEAPHRMVPLFSRIGDRPRCFYHSDYFESSQQHPADVTPRFRPEQRAVLDLWSELANTPEFHLDMTFEPGDMQFVNNDLIVHGRTAYRDEPDPAKRRLLFRLWLELGGNGDEVPLGFRLS